MECIQDWLKNYLLHENIKGSCLGAARFGGSDKGK